jgi:multiple sugar transport system permease protein
MPDQVRAVRRPRLAIVHFVLIIGAAVMAIPFIWEMLTTIKTFGESTRVPPVFLPASPQWETYVRVFQGLPFTTQFVNTALMTLGRTAGQVVLCSLAAYAFARLKFPGRNVIFVLFLSVLMVPPQLFVIPQYQIMQDLGWLNTLQALIVPGMFSAFGTFLLRQFFLGLPKELDEAAKLDGCNPLQTYWYVLLPLAKPGLIALAVMTVIWSWNDLLWPLVVNTDPSKMTLSAGLASLQGQYLTNYPVLMAGTFLATLPMIVVFVVLQRRFIQGIATTGSKG